MKLGKLSNVKGGEVATILEDKTFKDALQAMNQRRIGSLVVLDKNGKVSGILTERDLVSKIDRLADNCAVKEIMTPRAKMVVANPDDDLEHAMTVFTEKRIRHLPVMEGEKLVGMMSIGDAVKALLDITKEENRHLKDYILGKE